MSERKSHGEGSAGSDTGTGAPPLRRRNHALWAGPAVTLVGAFSYFQLVSTSFTLRDTAWPNLLLVFAGLAVSVLGVWRAYWRSETYRGKVLGVLGFAFSLFLTVAFNWYLFDFSYAIPKATNTVVAGTIAPELTLTSDRGDVVSLSDFRGKKVVLTFYRGFW